MSRSRIKPSIPAISASRRRLEILVLVSALLCLPACAGEAAEEAKSLALAQSISPGTAVGLTAAELKSARPSVRNESAGVIEDLPDGKHATYYFARLPLGSTLHPIPCFGCRVRAVVLEYDTSPRDSATYQSRRRQLRDQWTRALGNPDSSVMTVSRASDSTQMLLGWLQWRTPHTGVGLLSMNDGKREGSTLVNLPLRLVIFDRRVDPRSVWSAQ